ncbi:MAG: DEAD/DEAH box helicase family protein, partial [Actinomycetia bacterium]|nr:DEAD/DEAH box helicase family protein [Actinomycetes bacterium]
MNDKIEKLFSLSGPFAKLLPGYNFRESQLNMALSVWNSLENSNRIFIEAPTGVGKSLAYLVPAVLYSILSEEKIIISTETKTLQYQLIEKDIPLVKKALLEIDIDFKAEAAFGVNNYLCRRRFENPRTGEINFLEITDQIRNQSDNFKWGTNDEISSLIKSKDLKKYWQEINRESEYCLKSKCRYFKICHFYKMKRAIAKSDIIIVNNYLFFTNIISNYTVLPEFSAVIFDEAHNLEKIATEFFSFGFSTEQVEYVLNSIFSSRQGKGILKDISLNRETKKNIESVHNKAALSINALLEVLSGFYQKNSQGSKNDFPEKLIIRNSLNRGEIKELKENAVEKLTDYITLLESTKVFAKDSEEEMLFNGAIDRLSELKKNITDFIEMNGDNFVYWVTKK